MIVGIVLLATLWTSCKLRRRQARNENALDQDQGPVVFQEAIEIPSQQRAQAHKSSRVRHIDGTWHSRPYSSFGLSYTSSEASLESPGSRQTVLLPPRPDAAMNQDTIPPDGQHRENAEQSPLHRGNRSQTNNQLGEVSAEEAGYLPASPSILRPYLRADGGSRIHHIDDPYNNNNTAVQHMPGSYPPTQRSSYHTTYQHQSLSPNSRYSHILPTFLESYNAAAVQSDAQEPETRMDTEHAAHNAMLPRSSRVRFEQNPRRYYLARKELADTRAGMHTRGPSSEALFHQLVSPIDSEGNYYTRREPLSPSEPRVSPLHENSSLREASLAPLPLSPWRIARARAKSNAEMQPGRLSDSRPDVSSSRDLVAADFVVGSGRKPHVAFLTQGAFGARSVASTAQSQTQREPRKLQKRQPSEGQGRSMA